MFSSKLIGARAYDYGSTEASARDLEGHGTHTASIAAGNVIKGASFGGIAEGTARGGVPSSRIAAYKVCSPGLGCSSEDILAAFDDAIADGVDLITISVGGNFAVPLNKDPVSIGAFHASQKGILVIQSAGNQAYRGSVGSVAPWIFTVAASTTDRGIVTRVVLGNGSILTGKSVNSFKLNGTTFPLVYGKETSSEFCDEADAMDCVAGCLQTNLVTGKIVLCRKFRGRKEAFSAKALGSIGSYEGISQEVSFVVPLPASAVTKQDFLTIENYFLSTRAPKVDILTSESIRNLDAPRVASFSSKGPNAIISSILKPDITAPGVEILAAFSPDASPSDNLPDKRSVSYNILSGTSMSCPHVAGAAAYVKSFHPDWSPSAIKSALMTTAWRMDAKQNEEAEFAYGSGHIDPVKAVDPGLVYETLQEDYIQLLCGLGTDISTLKRIFGVNATCSAGVKKDPKDLNYPSITIDLTTQWTDNKTLSFSEKVTRTVTNVGRANSTYKAKPSISSGYSITVNPSVLTFGGLNQKKTFEVAINGKFTGEMISAALEWSDGVHNVRSPIVIFAN